MEPGRLTTLLDDLDEDRRSGTDVAIRLSAVCVEILGATGAGIMLMTDGEHRGTFGVSNDVINTVEELQFTLGEGPCIDAATSRQAVLEPDLIASAARWPAFSGPAIAAGVRAVFGFPITAGTACLGALAVYLDHPGDLRPDQLDDAAVMTDVIAGAVLAMQVEVPAGALAGQLETVLERRAVVYQAAGMLSVQLDMPVDDALVRIRTRSYLDSRPVNDVARDVVQRRLRIT